MVKGTHCDTIYDLLDSVDSVSTEFKSIIIDTANAKEIIASLIEKEYDFSSINYDEFEEGVFISIYRDESFDVIRLVKDEMPIVDDDTVFIQDDLVDYIEDRNVNCVVFSIGNDEKLKPEIKEEDDGHYISYSDSFTDDNGNISVYTRSFYSTNKDIVDLMMDIWRG